MIFRMRTTIVIDDELFRELKKRAAEENRMLPAVTQALRSGLARRESTWRARRVRFPSFSMGSPTVDLADRNQLFEVMDRS
jgi:hypothetical protein